MSSTATAPRPLEARPRSRAFVVDVGLTIAALVASLAQLPHGDHRGSGLGASGAGASDLDLVGIALVAAAAVPLVGWRRFPLGVFAITAAASVLLAGLGYPLGFMLGPAVALYLLASSRDRDRPWTWRTTATVVGLLVAYLAARTATAGGSATGELSHTGVTELSHTGLAWAIAWFAGERSRLRRQHVADLQERALRAEQEAERERLLAAAEERARIARDLHDSAGHAISVIGVRAGAARLGHAADPDRSRRALEAIEDLARQTVAEIDQMVGSLRQDKGAPLTGAVEAPTRLASVDALISHHAAAGLDVTLDTSGSPQRLGGPADQAAYRILQEALTNAARHGAGSARVAVAFADTAVEITVTNPVRTGHTRRAGGGHGLIGMRERASLLGGSLDAERANGTFRVRAVIPYGGRGA